MHIMGVIISAYNITITLLLHIHIISSMLRTNPRNSLTAQNGSVKQNRVDYKIKI